MDLQESERFKGLDVGLISIATDPLSDLSEDARRPGITTPFVSDTGGRVSETYGVLRWAMPSGEPGHTFVLVDSQGVVRWVRDYGAPENGRLMYVDVEELYTELVNHLAT